MKRTISMVIFALIMVGITSCSINIKRTDKSTTSKTEVDLTSKMTDFHKINIEAPLHVVFRQSDSLKVVIKGETKYVKKIKTVLEDSTLIFRCSSKQEIFGISNIDGVKVYISAPNLTKVTISGAGEFKAKDTIDTDNMIVLLKGAGNITFDNVICDMFYSSIKGVGNVKVEHLTAPKSSIFLNGVGNANVNYDNGGDVSCELHGVGNIKLSGNVKNIKPSVNGTGHIDTSNVKKI